LSFWADAFPSRSPATDDGATRVIARQSRRGDLDGLAKPDREIRALPAYLRRPGQTLRGRAVALDVGGTHMRAAEIELGDGAARLLGRPAENNLMLQSTGRELSGDEFFDAQATIVAAIAKESDIAVGYCFSYPATIAPDREAVLIEWTKGIRIRGVEGQPVGALLRQALRRHGKNVRAIPVLNDTVASLLAGAALAPQFARPIGVIVGTGTNMAGFFPVAAIAKLGIPAGWRADEMMAVNLESGDFTPREILTEWDDALDAALPPGQRDRQRFEKAVSGAYLPRLLRHVAGAAACAKAGFDPDDPKVDAGTVVALRDHALLGEAATALVDRSADLIAAGLAALIAAYRSAGDAEPRIGILVEGTLFQKTPGYPEHAAARLRELAPHTDSVFIPNEEGGVPANMLGAATAALSH
jgi:hexokinase